MDGQNLLMSRIADNKMKKAQTRMPVMPFEQKPLDSKKSFEAEDKKCIHVHCILCYHFIILLKIRLIMHVNREMGVG